MWMTGRRIFQAEGRPSEKALRWEVCSGNRKKAIVAGVECKGESGEDEVRR